MVTTARPFPANTAEAAMAERIDAALAPLEPEAQQRVLARLRALEDRRRPASDAIKDIEAEISALRDFRAVLDEWTRAGLKLERPPGSSAHRYVDAYRAGRVAAMNQNVTTALQAIGKVSPIPFVIEHDWASAFANATDFAEGDYPLPFDDVVFEFRISRMNLLVFCNERGTCVVAEMGKNWLALTAANAHVSEMRASKDDPDFGPLSELLSRQIRAVCIALDAEVAISETVRAPDRLNRKREARGRAAMLDYHVVRLSKRERAASLPDEREPMKHRSPRLHFVRGHWRHYETHKTWIKWHLRGSPDLGFIDKHYRL